MAKSNGRPFQEYFYYYAMESFLFRISKSKFSDKFVLKGGLMFTGWGIFPRRPTRDIDVQGYLDNSIENILSVVKEICKADVEPDGMVFDENIIRGERINNDANYQGVRVYITGFLGQAKIIFHLDVSFANAITPHEIRFSYPTMFHRESFEIQGYTIETTIAEKFQAMVVLGQINGRIKDFYDIWTILEHVDISGNILVDAIKSTFECRRTILPVTIPIALSDDFGLEKQKDWERELGRLLLNVSDYPSFPVIIIRLREFLLPAVKAAINQEIFPAIWIAGKSWEQ